MRQTILVVQMKRMHVVEVCLLVAQDLQDCQLYIVRTVSQFCLYQCVFNTLGLIIG